MKSNIGKTPKNMYCWKSVWAGGCQYLWTLVCCVFLFAVFPVFAAVGDSLSRPFRLMVYNVENAFDTRHDSLKQDEEFLPEGDKRWTTYRYWKKLNALSKVIAAVAQERIPDVVTLCEVENDSVVFDLTYRSALRTLGYRYVMTDSPDERGIDVALLYQPGTFRLLSVHRFRLNTFWSSSEPYPYKPTRDILYVSGRVLSGDTLHLLVCHLPSKAGATRQTDRHRDFAARCLRQICNTLLHDLSDARIVVSGDFNATPDDVLFRRWFSNKDGLRLLPSRAPNDPHRVRGTYNYQGNWSTLDHLLVSPFVRVRSGVHIADFPFLLEPDRVRGGLRPFRTYLGPRYLGGYSDHLPLYVDLVF